MDFWIVLAIWVIVLAVAMGITAIVNLRADDPRSTGVKFVSLVVVLALMTAAFAVAGFWGAGVILVLAIAAEAVHLVRRTRASDMSDNTPRYMISVAADLVGMHPQTLRIYETKGLVTPQRTAGNTRLYSDADLERLRLIQQLTTELGLNLAGVEHVIRLEEQIRRMQRTMERLEREMRETIAQVHKQYRRDLVPYDPTGVELVPKRWTSRG